MHPPPPALSELPLFPLQSVLFPGGYLPLRIFEVRYLDMIGRSHKAGTPFGVVCLTEGREVRQPPPRDAPLAARGARLCERGLPRGRNAGNHHAPRAPRIPG